MVGISLHAGQCAIASLREKFIVLLQASILLVMDGETVRTVGILSYLIVLTTTTSTAHSGRLDSAVCVARPLSLSLYNQVHCRACSGCQYAFCNLKVSYLWSVVTHDACASATRSKAGELKIRTAPALALAPCAPEPPHETRDCPLLILVLIT